MGSDDVDDVVEENRALQPWLVVTFHGDSGSAVILRKPHGPTKFPNHY